MRRLFPIILRVAIACVLLYAGFNKAMDPSAFAVQIENYRLVNALTARFLAAYLPWLELVLGLALLMRRLYLGALLLSMMLMLVFAAAVGSAWYRGLDIACGCFGSGNLTTATVLPLLRNLAILAALLLLLAMEKPHELTTAVDPDEAHSSAREP